MSIFGKLLGAAIDTVLLPVDVVKDVVMLPADASDGKDFASRTTRRLGRIGDKIEDAADEGGKL